MGFKTRPVSYRRKSAKFLKKGQAKQQAKCEKAADAPPRQKYLYQSLKPNYSMKRNFQMMLDTSTPADFSFLKFKTLDTKAAPMIARACRLGEVPFSKRGLFLTRSMWLNHNNIRDLDHLNKFVMNMIEFPEQLSYLDLSNNKISRIGKSLLNYPNLSILYMHGNCIKSIDTLFPLRGCKSLKVLTLFGNPIYKDCSIGNIRPVVIGILPKLIKLDYIVVTKQERMKPLPASVTRLLRDHGFQIGFVMLTPEEKQKMREKLQKTISME